MNFFTNFYNKVFSFFKPQELEEENNTGNVKDVARSRLKLVLMQDRTNLTPKILEQMRGELIDLLSKYVELDKELLELNFEQEGDQVALMLSIPVIRAKDEKEIEETLRKVAELKATNAEEDTSEENSNETSEASNETQEEPNETCAESFEEENKQATDCEQQVVNE